MAIQTAKWLLYNIKRLNQVQVVNFQFSIRRDKRYANYYNFFFTGKSPLAQFNNQTSIADRVVFADGTAISNPNEDPVARIFTTILNPNAAVNNRYLPANFSAEDAKDLLKLLWRNKEYIQILKTIFNASEVTALANNIFDLPPDAANPN